MLELKHLGSRRMLPAFIVTLAIIATGCGGAGAKPHGAGAKPAPAKVSARARGPVWPDSLQMVSATKGWALLWPSNPNGDSALAIARTTDGGRTWTVVTPPAAVRALGTGQALLEAATAERAWFAVPTNTSGPPGKTLVFGTVDGGRTWQQSAGIPDGYDPVALDFVGPQRGWLLDSLGAAMQQNPVRLYRSTDGGLHWSLVATSPRMAGDPATPSGLPLYCDKAGLAFASARTGWITGYCNSLADAVLVSMDGGARWATQPLPLPATLCESAGCEIPAPQVAGRSTFLQINSYPAAAYLLVSNGAGKTWQVSRLPAGAGPYPRIRFFSAEDGIAISGGSQGTIGRVFYVSTDGGLSWTAVRQGRHFGGNSADFDFVSLRAGFAWMQPDAEPTAPLPRLYRTSDSGRTWIAFTPRLG
ncbi:MAG TPA: hypothetical protein VME44_21140 [Streptosporangiaceae bacterium]|nr:hypothetical protein [Streptosporangiaceae bacterium]